jgi:hypothetical protein
MKSQKGRGMGGLGRLIWDYEAPGEFLTNDDFARPSQSKSFARGAEGEGEEALKGEGVVYDIVCHPPRLFRSIEKLGYRLPRYPPKMRKKETRLACDKQ